MFFQGLHNESTSKFITRQISVVSYKRWKDLKTLSTQNESIVFPHLLSVSVYRGKGNRWSTPWLRRPFLNLWDCQWVEWSKIHFEWTESSFRRTKETRTNKWWVENHEIDRKQLWKIWTDLWQVRIQWLNIDSEL